MDQPTQTQSKLDVFNYRFNFIDGRGKMSKPLRKVYRRAGYQGAGFIGFEESSRSMGRSTLGCYQRALFDYNAYRRSTSRVLSLMFFKLDRRARGYFGYSTTCVLISRNSVAVYESAAK